MKWGQAKWTKYNGDRKKEQTQERAKLNPQPRKGAFLPNPYNFNMDNRRFRV